MTGHAPPSRRPAGAKVLLTLVIGLPLAACGARSATVEIAPIPVETVAVRAPSHGETIMASGTLHRQRESALSFRAGGVLLQLNADAGDHVAQGQLLGVLDDTTLRARLRQAAADVERARRDLVRYEPLAATGMISRKRIDDLRTDLAQAQAAQDAAAFEQRGARLLAPASGVVLSRGAQSGEVVQPGQTILTIADESSGLVLRAAIADRDLAKVRLGAAAEVRLAAAPGEVLAARVTRIGQEADARSGAILVEVSLPSAAGLRSGLVGEVRISGAAQPGQDRDAVARVPVEAVLEAQGPRAYVYRVDAQGRAQRTAVTFAGFDGDDALVGGLAPGARLITTGAGFVADGQRVAVAERGAARPAS
jgi:RND family efflux transporter MFP subunit